MVIQHNIQALNGNRICNRVLRAKNRASEHLASGYRINCSADNASGLAISEKFLSQVRGLGKAEDNIQHGISLLQTADGALGEISNVIHRIRELCVQGADDINVEDDREAIQKEIGHMSQCIDDILEHTEFNTKKILKLGEAYVKYVETVVGTLPPNVTISGNSLQSGALPPFTATTSADYAFATIDFSALQTAADVQTLLETGFYTTCCTCDNKYNIRFIDNNSEPSKNVGRNPVFDVNIHGLTNGADVVDAIVKSVTTNHYTEFMVDSTDSRKLCIYDNRPNQQAYPAQNRGILQPELIHTDAVIDDPSGLQIQVGPNARQLVQLDLPTLSSAVLGVDTLSVKSNLAANTSLGRVDIALDTVNRERSKIGALQNRLEHAYEYAMDAEENQQTAESLLRDADIADEMLLYASGDILAQVAQSMIVQANQKPETVLSLLS